MKYALIFLALIPFGFVNATEAVHANIMERAQQAKNGVIVGITDQGAMAEDTAWLLAEQIKHDKNYAPLLVVLKPENRKTTLLNLHLAANDLPAVIVYDKQGKEIGRVVDVVPSSSIQVLQKVVR
jgi:hypothetical protein